MDSLVCSRSYLRPCTHNNIIICRSMYVKLCAEVVVYSQSYFGDHPIPSGLYFDCFGNETSLNDCQKPTTTCDFANVAGVYCTGNIITGTYII